MTPFEIPLLSFERKMELDKPKQSEREIADLFYQNMATSIRKAVTQKTAKKFVLRGLDETHVRFHVSPGTFVTGFKLHGLTNMTEHPIKITTNDLPGTELYDETKDIIENELIIIPPLGKCENMGTLLYSFSQEKNFKYNDSTTKQLTVGPGAETDKHNFVSGYLFKNKEEFEKLPFFSTHLSPTRVNANVALRSRTGPKPEKIVDFVASEYWVYKPYFDAYLKYVNDEWKQHPYKNGTITFVIKFDRDNEIETDNSSVIGYIEMITTTE